MSYKDLNILVLLREISDSRPPARVITRGAAICDRGLRRIPNPADLTALEEALTLKDTLGARVTVLAIGPARLDDTLRLACSMGADRAIRFHDHGTEGGDAAADARILARALAILAPSLVVTGNRLADRGDDPVPALAAASAGIPCISATVSLTLKQDGIEVLRKGDRGSRQTAVAPLPCLVLCDEGRTPRYPSVTDVTRSLSATIETWDLAHLGLPFWQTGATGAYLAAAEFGVPRPDPVRIVTPDPGLPAFERIISLLSGGIKAREGKMHTLPADAAAEGIWRILAEEGLIPEGTS
jgi:electron transfer flavoprotein beta subunit